MQIFRLRVSNPRNARRNILSTLKKTKSQNESNYSYIYFAFTTPLSVNFCFFTFLNM